MKTSKKILIIVASLIFSLGVSAQTLVYSNPTIAPGTATVDVTVTWNDAGAPGILGMSGNTDYDVGNFTFQSCVGITTVCNENVAGSGIVNIGHFGNPANGVIATITFISGTAPVGTYPVGGSTSVPTPDFTDASGSNPLPTTDGIITVAVGPATPDWSPAVAAVTFTPVVAGGANPTEAIAVTNAGAGTLTGTCTLASVNEITLASGAVSLAAAASTTLDLTCDATTAGTFTNTLSCTHNGDGTTQASPAVYPLSCTINPVAGTATVTPTPAGGTTLNFAALTGATAINTVTLAESGGVASSATCTVTGADFAVAPAGPQVIAANGNVVFTVTYTAPAAGPVTGTLSCISADMNGGVAVTYPLNGIVTPAGGGGTPVNVPTMSLLGYIVLTLGLGLLGFWGFRRQA